MKKTQRKDAVRNIRNRLVSYLSVCLVIMLGLGGFFSTKYMSAGVAAKGEEYYKERGFEDYEVISSLGISEANLKKIAATEGVKDVEGVMQSDGTLAYGSSIWNVTVISLTERISVPEITEGKKPQGKDQCMIGEDFAEAEGLKVGDKVRLSMSTPDMGDPLYVSEFRIAGLMHHPNYVRRLTNKTVVLPLEAFNPEVTEGLYTRAFVSIDDPEGVSILSDLFFDETDGISEDLNTLADELSLDRANEMKQSLYDMIDEEWAKALAELEAAQAEIDAGQAELDAKLAAGLEKLREAENELERTRNAALKKLRQAEAEIAASENLLNQKKAELEKGKAEYNKKKAQLDKIKKQLGRDIREIHADVRNVIGLVKRLKAALDPDGNTTIEVEGITDEEWKQIAEEILAYRDKIIDARKQLDSEELINALKELEALTGIDLITPLDSVRNTLPVAELESFFNLIGDYTGGSLEDLEGKSLNSFNAVLDVLNYLDQMLTKLEDAEAQLAAAKEQIEDGERKIADGERQLADAKSQLADAKKKFNAEIAAAQKKIKAGWAEYYAEKNKYESQLAEAIALLAVNRKAAEDKLAEARASVGDIKCRCIVTDRRANAGYADIRSNVSAISGAGNVFGILFMIITAIVCFSTLAIIIEEQKKMVGTVKAFGFFRREILGKYLLFGVSASIIGCLLGTGLSLILSDMIQRKFAEAGQYQFGVARSVITPVPTAIAFAGMIAICCIATVIACSDILKTPASMLMKGAVSRKDSSYRKKTSRRGGSLYSRLILRNMRDDKTRVMVSVAVIAFSCMLIGIGISMKIAYDGMSERQVSDIYRYDFRMDVSDDVSADERATLEKTLAQAGTAWMPATYETYLYRWNNSYNGMYLLCADPERIGEFISIGTPDGDVPLTLPEDGILVQNRMEESYGMTAGSALPLLDETLTEYEAPVTGSFHNYMGRLTATSPAGYKKIFGKLPENNCYFVTLNGAGEDELKNSLLSVTDGVSFENKSDITQKFSSIGNLYNIIVLLTTGIAILMSFMILTNLANIFLNRKKTELTVMRINGFSIKQTKGYLAKESVITAALGIILGVAVGSILTPRIIYMVQLDDVEFVRSFHPEAWIIAVVLEALFAVITYSLVFRKVKNLNFRDIA